MKRIPKRPDWFRNAAMPAALRRRLETSFTPSRDGYVRWYKGKPRFVCAKSTPPEEVEDRWGVKRKKIDAEEEIIVGDMTLRQATMKFLADCKLRVTTGKPRPMSERTYHNLIVALNHFGKFIGGDTPISEIGPEDFSDYAAEFGKWKPSGWDSVVTRVGQLFRWAVQMEYIDRYRPGPAFQRPAKQSIRDERIEKRFSFTPDEIAKLWNAANHTMQCFIALGVCAAFNNADVGNLTRDVIDLDTGIIDYQRRKTGKIRRVIPLPQDVVDMLKRYPVNGSGFFFLTEAGNAFTRTVSRSGKYMPANTVTWMFGELVGAAGVARLPGRGFKGLRTTFRNLAPRSGYDLERTIIMGHAKGTVDLDAYLEDVGTERLRFVVSHVWEQIKTARHSLQTQVCEPGCAPASSVAACPAGSSGTQLPAASTPSPAHRHR